MSQSQVLVPVDGSPASLRAVDFAIEMVAQNPSTSLVLLNVQSIPAIELAAASEAMATDWLQDAALQASVKALKDAKGQCENASVAFKTLVRTGQPVLMSIFLFSRRCSLKRGGALADDLMTGIAQCPAPSTRDVVVTTTTPFHLLLKRPRHQPRAEEAAAAWRATFLFFHSDAQDTRWTKAM